MKNQKRIKVKAAAVTNDGTDAISSAELTALGEKLLAQQRAIRDAIPDFLLPHPKRLRLTGPATRVNDVVIKEGLGLCETDALLAHEIDRAEVLYGEEYERAFANLRDEMENCFKGLDYSIRSKRFKNGETMLRLMNLGHNLAKTPEHAGLRIGVAAMRKAFRTSRRRQTTPPETPAPQPAPTSPATEQPRAK